VIKDEKAKEAETIVKRWLQKIKVVKDLNIQQLKLKSKLKWSV